jgi:integrase
MPWEAVPDFVENLLHDGTVGTCREAMEFLILSAARSGEVRKMQWLEVDFENKIWTVPAEKMKAQKQHRVPISSRMREILQKQLGAHPTLVFPSVRGKVLSDNTLSKFLRDHKVASDIRDRFAVVHGFRSSFRNWGAQHSYPEHLLEHCLAHTERNYVVAAYRRTDFLEERRPIIEAWATFVSGRTEADSNVS